MNLLSKAIALYKKGDYVDALRFFEQAGEIYGPNLVKANIFMCRKSLGLLSGDAASIQTSNAITRSRSVLMSKATTVTEVKVQPVHGGTSPKNVDSAAKRKDANVELATTVCLTLIRSIKPNEAIRYPTSPKSECIVDLMLSLSSIAQVRDVWRIEDALQIGRHAIAEKWLNDALVERPCATELHMLAARLDYLRGNYEQVADKLVTLLSGRNAFSEALILLAQTYSRQGRLLEAMATLTNGRGLMAWRNSSPTMEQAKLAVQLDWISVAMSCEGANAYFTDTIKKMCSITGLPIRLVDVPYSLFFLSCDGKNSGCEDAGLFLDLRERSDCMQIAWIDTDVVMSEIECVGEWAFVFTESVAVHSELLDTIFAQKRSNEIVVKIMKARMDASGVPVSFNVAGVLASADALRVFGKVTLTEWLQAAERSLRIKTVLI